MTPAQLLVRGSVTHVQATTAGGGGGIGFRGIHLGGSKDAADITPSTSSTPRPARSRRRRRSPARQAGKKGLSVGYWGSKLGGLTGNMEGYKKDNVGQACIDAVGQAIEFLTKQLEKIPWEGSIALAKEGKIVVNRGTREGVEVGQKFDVGQVGAAGDDDTGERLDSEMKAVAMMEVTEVKEKIAYCKASAAPTRSRRACPSSRQSEDVEHRHSGFRPRARRDVLRPVAAAAGPGRARGAGWDHDRRAG